MAEEVVDAAHEDDGFGVEVEDVVLEAAEHTAGGVAGDAAVGDVEVFEGVVEFPFGGDGVAEEDDCAFVGGFIAGECGEAALEVGEEPGEDGVEGADAGLGAVGEEIVEDVGPLCQVAGEGGFHAEAVAAGFELEHECVSAGVLVSVDVVVCAFEPVGAVVGGHHGDEAGLEVCGGLDERGCGVGCGFFEVGGVDQHEVVGLLVFRHGLEHAGGEVASGGIAHEDEAMVGEGERFGFGFEETPGGLGIFEGGVAGFFSAADVVFEHGDVVAEGVEFFCGAGAFVEGVPRME